VLSPNADLGENWTGHDSSSCLSEDESTAKYFRQGWFKHANGQTTFKDLSDKLVSSKICRPCAVTVLKGANWYQQSRDPEQITMTEDRLLRDVHFQLIINLFSSELERWFPLDHNWVRYVLMETSFAPELAREIFDRRRSEYIRAFRLFPLLFPFSFSLCI
jgi:hypothetical protein